MKTNQTPEACPSWCVADHAEQDHPDDVWHQSQRVFVPLIELTGCSTVEGWRFAPVSVEFTVGLEQRVGEEETFVYFGIGEVRERNFRLSIESTERLICAIEDIITDLGAN